jgi:hypothetical protein
VRAAARSSYQMYGYGRRSDPAESGMKPEHQRWATASTSEETNRMSYEPPRWPATPPRRSGDALAVVAIAAGLVVAAGIGAFASHDLWPAPTGAPGPRGEAGARGPSGASPDITGAIGAALDKAGYCVAVTMTTGSDGNQSVNSVQIAPPVDHGGKLSCPAGSFVPLAPARR